MKRHPNRSLSVLGLARATKRRDRRKRRRRHYRALLVNYGGADVDVAALKEARAASR